MRAIHVVPEIGERASGPSYSVVRLCESLIDAGIRVRLATLDSGSDRVLPWLQTFPRGWGPHALGVSPRMRRWLEAEAASGSADLIHNHSLWMMPNVYSGWASQGRQCRFVVSPRGTLSKWALRRSAVRKKAFWHLLQSPVLRDAACFHATSESEYEDIRSLGFRQPICILPNGIDVPPVEMSERSPRRELLFLGRVHPTKGVDILLKAWKAVEPRFGDWTLRIAGPDNDGYLKAMQVLASRLRLQRVTFAGPLYDDAKLHAYRCASLFVLPTHSENFGLTVGEALAAGTPVIATKGAPWSGLQANGAGWWIDIGVDPLIAALEQGLSTPPSNLIAMGNAGRSWMSKEFSWDKIGVDLAAAYHWLLYGGSSPPCLRLS